jgi:hypothetical protein
MTGRKVGSKEGRKEGRIQELHCHPILCIQTKGLTYSISVECCIHKIYRVCEIGLFMPRSEQNPRCLANEIVQISPFNCFEELPY